MITETFAQGNSWIHQLDPRIKIIVAISFSVITALSEDYRMLLQLLGFSLLLLLSSRLDAKSVGKRSLVINTFILFIWLLMPFTYPGNAVFHFGPLVASMEGIVYSALITVKSNAIMFIVISLFATSSMSTLIHALKRLHLPEKLIYLLFFIYRYVHVIKIEFERLNNSMLLRGFKPKTSMHCYRSYAYLVGMLLVRSYERAKRIYQAMLCRGFKGKFYMFDDFSLRKIDYAFLSFSILFFSYLAIFNVF